MKLTKLSFREKKSLQLKQNILIAAAHLFRQRGFLSTTLEDIALEVGISKANIYNYFRNKGQVLYEVLSLAARQSIEQARLIIKSSASPWDKLENLVKSHIRIETDASTSPGGIAVFERRNLHIKLRRRYDALRDEYENLFRDILEEAVRAAEIRQCDTRLMTRLILGLINSMPHWFKQSGPLTGDDVAKEIWELISHGIVYPGAVSQEVKKHGEMEKVGRIESDSVTPNE